MDHILAPIRRHANYAVQEADNLNFITGYVIEKMTELIGQAEKEGIPREKIQEAFLRGVEGAQGYVKGRYSDAVREAFARYNGPYYDVLSMGLGAVERAAKGAA